MRQYRLFQAPIMTFFSPRFYRDVALHWKGTGFAYLFLLLTISVIPNVVRVHNLIGDYIIDKTPAIISQVPHINIINGELSADVEQPYTIKDPDSGEVLVLIDTTGDIVSYEMVGAHSVLKKNELIFKKSEVETRIISLKKIEYFTIDQQKVSGWLDLLRKFFALFLFPFSVVGVFVYRIIQMLVYAAIGLLFVKCCKSNISYQALIRLSVMAVSPIIVFSTVMGIINVNIPFQGIIYFIVAMGYLFMGVKAASCQGEDGIEAINNIQS